MKLFTTLFISLLGINSYNAIAVDYTQYNKSVDYTELENSSLYFANIDLTTITDNLNDHYSYLSWSINTAQKIDFNYSLFNRYNNKFEFYENVDSIKFNTLNSSLDTITLYFMSNENETSRVFNSNSYDLSNLVVYIKDCIYSNSILMRFNYTPINYTGGELSYKYLNVLKSRVSSKLFYRNSRNQAYWFKYYLELNGIANTWSKPFFNTNEIFYKDNINLQIANERSKYGLNFFNDSSSLNFIYNNNFGADLFVSSHIVEDTNNRGRWAVDYSQLLWKSYFNYSSGADYIQRYDLNTQSYIDYYDFNLPFLVFNFSDNLSITNMDIVYTIEGQFNSMFGGVSGGDIDIDNSNPLFDVFNLLGFALGSFTTLLSYRIGSYSLALFVFAPLVVGFILWIIHLVKRG